MDEPMALGDDAGNEPDAVRDGDVARAPEPAAGAAPEPTDEAARERAREAAPDPADGPAASTGDPAVDEALTRLVGLDDQPLRAHVAAFDAVHGALQDRLADAEG